jgi:hypothetical protein
VGMRFLKYCIDITDFEWRPWLRVELEYEGENEDRGVVYVHRGWLWFVISYTETFGWEQFQEIVKNGVKDEA